MATKGPKQRGNMRHFPNWNRGKGEKHLTGRQETGRLPHAPLLSCNQRSVAGSQLSRGLPLVVLITWGPLCFLSSTVHTAATADRHLWDHIEVTAPPHTPTGHGSEWAHLTNRRDGQGAGAERAHCTKQHVILPLTTWSTAQSPSDTACPTFRTACRKTPATSQES